MRRHAHNFGFTLMELVLVLLVIAICAAIAAPQLQGSVKGRALPNAANTLVATTRWCRAMAVSEGLEYRLNFDVPAGKWWATKDDGTGSNTFVAVTADPGREYTLPEGLSISSITFTSASSVPASDQGAYVSFRSGGLCDPATIVLANDVMSLRIISEGPSLSFHIAKEAQ